MFNFFSKPKHRHKPHKSVNTSLECKVDGTSKYCGHDKPLRPIIARAGGKSQLAPKIIKEMKPHKIYDEPFVGGGAVFLKKPLAEKNYINDKDKDVVKVYKKFKSSDGFNQCNNKPSKSRFNEIKSKGNKSACDIAYLNKNSFGSQGTSYAADKHPERFRNQKNLGIIYQKAHKDDYKEKLKNTQVTAQDFKAVMKKADSKQTVHFLDPPYFGADKMYKERGVTPKEVCDTAKHMKGQVLITYNDVPEVRKSCRGLKMRKISSRYTLGADSNNKKSKELLISKG